MKREELIERLNEFIENEADDLLQEGLYYEDWKRYESIVFNTLSNHTGLSVDEIKEMGYELNYYSEKEFNQIVENEKQSRLEDMEYEGSYYLE